MKINYLLIQLGFAATTLTFYGLLFVQLKKSLGATDFTPQKQRKIFNNTVIALIGWTIFISAISLSGFLSDFTTFPPRQVIVLLVPLISISWAVSTNTAKEVLRHIPAHVIIYLQSFRIVVEILLWMLFLDSLIPIQMTFEGGNLDILSGISAPIVAYFFFKKKVSKSLAIAWNIICLGLLLNIVVTAILSMPTPLRVFMNEPANTIVARFPVVWLPGLLVPLAYGLHFISLRQLLISDKGQ